MKVRRRYTLVRVIAFLLKLIAWVILILSVLGAIFGGVAFFGRPAQGSLLPPALMGTGTVVVSLLTGLFWFLPLFALGSVLTLLLDIEENTRALANEPVGYEVSGQPPA